MVEMWNRILPNAGIRLKKDKVGELLVQLEIEERIHFNLFPVSSCEFTLWNNG